MKHRAKELSLKDTAIICARCHAEVGLLKTFRCVTPERHHAKCSFGYLRRVEIAHCYEDPKKRFLADEANYGFIKLHMDSWGLDEPDLSQRNTQSSSQARVEGGKKPKYAFAECNNHHIVGYVEDDRFYLTDVSELKLMFPLGTYDDWCDKYWADQYRAAFEYQTKLNYSRATLVAQGVGDKTSCELCFKDFADANEFIIHCQSDKRHKELVNQYNDESYDAIFEELDRQAAAEEVKMKMD